MRLGLGFGFGWKGVGHRGNGEVWVGGCGQGWRLACNRGMQADPEPQNSILSQRTRTILGRRTESSSCGAGPLSSASSRPCWCSACWMGAWPTCRAPTLATWASGPTAAGTSVPGWAKSLVSRVLDRLRVTLEGRLWRLSWAGIFRCALGEVSGSPEPGARVTGFGFWINHLAAG